jgi:hypothetical protein
MSRSGQGLGPRTGVKVGTAQSAVAISKPNVMNRLCHRFMVFSFVFSL